MADRQADLLQMERDIAAARGGRPRSGGAMANPAALLWTEEAVAAAMGVEVVDVQKLVAAGELKPVRLLGGATLRFRPADIADAVDRLVEPATDVEQPPEAPAKDMNALIRGAAGRSS